MLPFKGLILQKSIYQETRALITLFTEQGIKYQAFCSAKERALLQGVCLEGLLVRRYPFAPWSLKEYQYIWAPKRSKIPYQDLKVLIFCLNLFNTFFPVQALPMPSLYTLLAQVLYKWDQEILEYPFGFLASFLWRFLKESGFFPLIQECLYCGQELFSKGGKLEISMGGFACMDCVSGVTSFDKELFFLFCEGFSSWDCVKYSHLESLWHYCQSHWRDSYKLGVLPPRPSH